MYPSMGSSIRNVLGEINTLGQGQERLNAMRMQNQMFMPEHQANLQNQLIQNRYLSREKEAGLKHQNLINQYYGPQAQANINHLNTSAEWQRFVNANPLYNTEEGKLKYMQDHPKEFGGAGNAINGNPGAGDNQQVNKVLGGLPPEAINQVKNSFAGGPLPGLGGQMPGQAIPSPRPPNELANANLGDLALQKYKAEITAKQNKGLGAGSMGVNAKDLRELTSQLMKDNGWDEETADKAASSYLDGNREMPDGTPLPDPSGKAKSLMAGIYGRNSPKALQNQAANMDVVAKEINDIDIEPIAKFAGIAGRMDVAKEMRKMAMGGNVSEDFRKYKEFQDVTKIFAMDTLRKGFGTSVVPEYVYATLGKATNPFSDWWNDPKQVVRDFNKVKGWVNQNSKMLTHKARFGSVDSYSNEEKSPSSETESAPSQDVHWEVKDGKMVRM
jgi:hypothetical protein